jgi:hypothetical protein
MFSITKFLGGFAIWQGEKFGKILFIIIISGLVVIMGIGFYHKLTCATTTNKAEKIENPTYSPRVSFGCANVKIEK